MTPRTDEIQKLIADIDNLLASGGKRLSRLLSSQVQEPQEILERIRNFLVKLEESDALESNDQNQFSGQLQSSSSPLLTKFVDQSDNHYLAPLNQFNQEQTNFLSQALKNELSVLIQPLQGEITALLQERTTLVQEIRQLEQRRLHNYSLSQQLANQEQIISEFLQVLMSRLVPTLKPQMEDTSVNSPSYVNSNMELTSATSETFLESSDQAERLTQLAKELDQRLLSLDGTVNVVFEALQRNINTYHESLSQSLARMHSTGVQGEQLMASFLNNLTQYLQQQFPSPQPSVSVVASEILPPPLSTKTNAIAPKITQPIINSAEVSSEPLELIESEPLFDFTTNEQSEDTVSIVSDRVSTEEITDDLDAVLLELGVDTSSPDSTITPAELPQDNWDIVDDEDDEVDQLYASLFGGNNLNTTLEVNPELVTDQLRSAEISETPSTPSILSAEIAETPSILSEAVQDDLSPPEITNTAPLEEVDSAAIMPDAWFDQSDIDLFDFPQEIPNAPLKPTDLSDFSLHPENLIPPPSLLEKQENAKPFFLEDRGFPNLVKSHTDSPVESVSQSSSRVIFSDEQDSFQLQPNSADTIRNLTDLLTSENSEEQLQEVSFSVAFTKKTIAETFDHQLSTVISNEESLDNYIAASPQENLLSPQTNQTVNVPDISLDEEQWLQLHQDLAIFDEQLQPTVSPGSQIADHKLPVDFYPQDLPLVTVANTEKKKEVTSSAQNHLVVSTSNPKSNPDILLNQPDSVWYLGIDLGTTGISATLLNRSTSIVYPIYWSAEHQPGATSFQQSFRLPAEVYLPSVSVPQGETENIEAILTPEKVVQQRNNLSSAQLKPYLQVAIPYKNEQQKWEPVLQFNEFSAGPLVWVVRSLSKLLLTLKSDSHSTTQGLIAAAVGLDEGAFPSIIGNIAGIICTCPSSWSEQYRFNVREAILTSKLVQHPQQVFFVEEAIASLLSVLDSAKGETVQVSTRQGLRPTKIGEHSLLGNTLVVNIGATATEMALVDLPESLLQLTHDDFMLHGFAYASKGIEQDIICQLLFPPKYRQSRLENPESGKITTPNPLQWQPAFPGLDQMRWQSLGLEALNLPHVGEPDIAARIRLQQHLESSLLGQAALDAALALKLILQHQETFTLEIADQRWVLQRRDLESQVFVPFVRRLNRELNKLLVAWGIPTEAINQAILTGGVASLDVVNRWLRQKLPNAKIIQDLYLGENGAPNCSRVAYGLAMLPLHPQVLEESRQQYTDYFLFTELLRLIPERNLSFSDVLSLFEGTGINTSICQQRLLAFLEGELPAGFIPSSVDLPWLTENSQENSSYKAIALTPLFEKQGSLTYRPNSQQLAVLRRYLDAIKASTQQSLEEPYTVNFASEVSYAQNTQ